MGDPVSLTVGASIASAGLGAGGSIAKGFGVSSADDAAAARAERAAEMGRLQAENTDTAMREQLNTTLGNIQVIRAAAKIDPSSPTSAVLMDRQRMLSDRQRSSALLNIQSQVSEDEASANYLQQAGDFALGMSFVDATGKLLSAGSKANFGGGGGGGFDSSGNPV